MQFSLTIISEIAPPKYHTYALTQISRIGHQVIIEAGVGLGWQQPAQIMLKPTDIPMG